LELTVENSSNLKFFKPEEQTKTHLFEAPNVIKKDDRDIFNRTSKLKKLKFRIIKLKRKKRLLIANGTSKITQIIYCTKNISNKSLHEGNFFSIKIL